MKTKLFYLILVLSSIFFSKTLFAEDGVSSRNGYQFPVKGEIRLFLVFAEMININSELGALGDWQVGQMPPDPGRYAAEVEQYFREASFGEYNLVVDYYPELIQVDSLGLTSSDIISNYGAENILAQLDRKATLAGRNYLLTAHNRRFPEDFDLWTLSSWGNDGKVKQNRPDGKVDFIIFYFRVNPIFAQTRSGGKTRPSGISTSVLGKNGSNSCTWICNENFSLFIRHEYAHTLLGPNEFHSGDRGAGISNYIHNFSGYGLLSGWNNINGGCNAWDRYRLGWKHPDKSHYISALNVLTGREEETDLSYVPGSSAVKEFILRDFTEYGDAVRVRLPYLEDPVNPQWIWLENHQIKPGTIEYRDGYPHKGMYVNYQVGNESFSSFSSRTNYYATENSLGNYDLRDRVLMTIPNGNREYALYTHDSLSNPFTGYNFASVYAYDENGDDLIRGKEEYFPYKLTIGDSEIPASDCSYLQYISLGSKYDAFVPGQGLNICSNPAPVPRLTYPRDDKYSSYIHYPGPIDNRKIYLNGLSIQMVEQRANGDIKVRIKYNEYDVKNDVRWCGDIVLNEKVRVNPSCRLLLDQGRSATRVTNPVSFQGKKIFADPTYFTCRKGSELILQQGSSMALKNNSSLVADSGSVLTVTDANISVESGSTFKLKRGSRLNVSGESYIKIKRGGYLCVEEGALVNLAVLKSCILLEDGSRLGVNPTTLSSSNGDCSPSVDDIAYTGKGGISVCPDVVYLQNETLTVSRKVFGKKVIIGSKVTTSKPQGEYVVKSGASLQVIATEKVSVEGGFRVEKGATVDLNP